MVQPLGLGVSRLAHQVQRDGNEVSGETIDLHAGGEDLIFPHHECEIAQSESLTGKTFANHWVHTKFLQVNGEKMSKSLGNFFTVRDLVEGKGADPLALRYALISQNFGVPHNLTMELLKDARRKSSDTAFATSRLTRPWRLMRRATTRLASRFASCMTKCWTPCART